jgi:putative hydrolase of the HAD superfamily
MNSIRAIYFDAVGTLIHPEPPAAVAYAEAARLFGSRHSAQAIAARFAAAFAGQEAIDRANRWVTSEEREHARWRAIVAEVLDDALDPDGCFEFLYRHFARPEAWRSEAGAEEALGELEARGYQLGLASNFDARLHEVAKGLAPLKRFVDNIVVSSEVGHRKPARAFFEALATRTGFAATQILHVGDDPDNDLAGAAALGMPAILFDPRARHPESSGPRIESLRDIVPLLSGD